MPTPDSQIPACIWFLTKDKKGSARAPRAVVGAPAGSIRKPPGEAAIQNDSARAGDASSARAPKTTREWLAVVFDISRADVAAGGENETVSGDFLEGR